MTSVSHKRPKCELLVERPREHLNTHDCACALFRISSKRLCTAALPADAIIESIWKKIMLASSDNIVLGLVLSDDTNIIFFYTASTHRGLPSDGRMAANSPLLHRYYDLLLSEQPLNNNTRP